MKKIEDIASKRRNSLLRHGFTILCRIVLIGMVLASCTFMPISTGTPVSMRANAPTGILSPMPTTTRIPPTATVAALATLPPTTTRETDLVQNKKQPIEVYMGLRKLALSASPTSVGVPVEPNSKEPYGILMDVGLDNGVATIVSFASGDASLYLSSGGGMIGEIGHENIHNAAKHFVSVAKNFTDRMELVTVYPLPSPGTVRFYVLTPQGILSAEASQEDLGRRRNTLSPLFYAGQDVITGFRLLMEKNAKQSIPTKE